MKMSNLKFILLLLLLFATGFAALSITGYSTSQSSYMPGSQGYVTITITNPSSASADSMTAVFVSITAPPEISISSQENIGDIESLGSRVVTLPFRIKEDAQSGFYSINVKVGGYTKNPSGSTQSYYSTSISVPVMVVRLPIFSASTKQDLLTGIDNVDFVLKNSGGPAKDVTITVNSGTIGILGESQLYLGELKNEANFSFMIDSRNAQDGPAEIPLLVKYKDALGTSHEETVNVRMTVKKEQLDIVFLQDSSVITKKESTLVLKVKNNGKETINNLKIYFTDPSIRLKDSDSLSYGDIAPNEEKSASAVVFATYSPGLNYVPARITWVEKDIEKEETKSIPLTITSDADVSVYVEAKPAPLQTGTEHTLSVLVSNLGSYEISNVEVEMDSDALKNIDVSNKQYIGNLANDDFSTVQFKVKTTSSPGSYTMKIKVNYRDTSGEWKSKTITQPITIYEAEKQGNGQIYLLVGGLIVVVAAIWYFFIRKKKAQK